MLAVTLTSGPKLRKQMSEAQTGVLYLKVYPRIKGKSCCSVFTACSQSVLGLNKNVPLIIWGFLNDSTTLSGKTRFKFHLKLIVRIA